MLATKCRLCSSRVHGFTIQSLLTSDLLPHIRSDYDLTKTRGIKLFEIFDKEKAQERKREIQEEMKRGYFDDFKDLKETQGRMFQASEQLSPAETSSHLPPLAVVEPGGTEVLFPPPPGSLRVALLCVAFRAGAEDKLQSWSETFREALQGRSGARWFELSLVESVVMSVWPFKQMILRSGLTKPAAPSEACQLQAEHIFHFGDATEIRRVLGMTNRLTGYAYLIDAKGRVRWRGSGQATATEADNLVACSKELLSSSD
ncbi:hypothetical protein WJX75_007088 [Coccomyxa subellipsoidea]|uniref:ATPase assembly factor ATP10 n=1 Tax=Coccomyxa subellipsoidea TaxID=248742 RepID=A0ABR2YBP4_9CHLO